MSRPSEPDEMVSMSIDRSFLPSRMIEPLPKLRSIWESAASRAFDLSMDDPSTRRSAAPPLISRAPYGRDSEDTEAARRLFTPQFACFSGGCEHVAVPHPAGTGPPANPHGPQAFG